MKPLLLITCLIILISCNNDKKPEKEAILLADREAPLGWIYLWIYEDSTFEFVSRGLRDKKVYPGTVKLRNDTLFFNYTDSIPKAGKTAVIGKYAVVYIDGEYPERVEIKLNKLKP